MHEAKIHERNCFITLTMSADFGPVVLRYEYFQSFMRRLRKDFAPESVRFYMCGEYGDQFERPHFHACLFGVDFDDKVYWSKSADGDPLYRSARLERLWTSGFSTVGSLTFKSAAYVARYCVQKRTGQLAVAHYKGRQPEFNHMSLKPGIGADFFFRYMTDIYPHDYVVINGHEAKPPRYYDTLYGRVDAARMRAIRAGREDSGWERRHDSTPERLRVKEEVASARARLLKRGLSSC